MNGCKAKTPGPKGLSPAIEPMRKAAEQADDGAMEDRFVPFLEGCLSARGLRGTDATRGRPSPPSAR